MPEAIDPNHPDVQSSSRYLVPSYVDIAPPPPVALPILGSALFILADGTWNDAGQWRDSQQWNDSNN